MLEFLSSEDPSSRLAKTKRQMLRRLEAISRTGMAQVTDISHQISGDIWQIEKGDIRILYFYDREKVIVLSHGFVKQSRKTRQGEIQRAREALQRYKAERNGIQILEE